MGRLLCVTFLTIGAALPAHANHATVKRNVNLRRDPSTAQAPIRLLAPPETLELLELTPTTGYLKVRTTASEEGWVWSRNIVVEPHTPEGEARAFSQPATGFEARKARATARGSSTGPCADNLYTCPTDGCEHPGTPHALLNNAKRGIGADTSGPFTRLTFQQFVRLQAIVDDKGIDLGHNSHLTQAERDELKDLNLGDGTTAGEGDRVELVGFIASDHELGSSSKESVNCRLNGRFADNDVHIPIVARADDTVFHSVVVEPIPQDRPNSWTLAAFRKLQRDGTQIRIRGQLVLDNAHRVNDSPDDAGVSNEPKRLTVWEIHPVKHVFVCKKASNNCDSTTAAEWRESS
jgi:hypothetical protein